MVTRLLVVTGLPGVGKTTVARVLADRLDARLVRTDSVRADCVPDPAYTHEERVAVYDEVFRRARETLRRGESVVLDGTFRERTDRTRAADLAAETDATLGIVAVECSESTVRDRLEAREGDASDADFEVYRRMRAAYEPVELPHVTVDNSGGVGAVRTRVDALLDDAR